MISRITGKLCDIDDVRALIDVNGITYEILISKWAAGEILNNHGIGAIVTFHTYHYIEGSATMGNLIPRLVGFVDENDLRFFSYFITVQGLSVKKGLRALIVSTSEIARAIESGDEMALKRLPEIGGKTAKKIIMELKGKLQEFILFGDLSVDSGMTIVHDYSESQLEAIEVLLQLEYTREEAEKAVQRVIDKNPDLDTADAIIQDVFRNK